MNKVRWTFWKVYYSTVVVVPTSMWTQVVLLNFFPWFFADSHVYLHKSTVKCDTHTTLPVIWSWESCLETSIGTCHVIKTSLNNTLLCFVTSSRITNFVRTVGLFKREWIDRAVDFTDVPDQFSLTQIYHRSSLHAILLGTLVQHIVQVS